MDRIGEGPADTLMGYLPPVGWADVATKQDLQALQTVMHAEISELRSDLRREMNELGSDLRREMNQLGSDLRREMNQLGSDLRREMSSQGASLQTALRTQFYWTITLMVLLMTGFVAALRLG